jgi:hypothetical protein
MRPMIQDLPFIIKLVRTESDLNRALKVRKDAYSKHHPTLGEILAKPEFEDSAPGSLVIAAFSKQIPGEMLGSVRVLTNIAAPLELERELPLPSEFEGLLLLQVSRLSVLKGPHSALVKAALFKALYQYAASQQISRIVLAAIPPIDRIYNTLGFHELFEGRRVWGLPSAGGNPVKVKYLDITHGRSYWTEIGSPLVGFIFDLVHPDIKLFASVSNPWTGEKRRS